MASDDPPTQPGPLPLPAVIPGYPTGARIFGLNKQAWFKAIKRGDIPTVSINGRMFLQVAAVERQIGRKLTWADLKEPPKKPRTNARKRHEH